MLLLSFFVIGCSTGYKQSGGGLTGFGFQDFQIEEDTYKIRFSGNAITTKEKVEDLALLRASELAIKHGYNYFVVLQEEDDYTSKTQKPTKTITQEEKKTSSGRVSTTTAEEGYSQEVETYFKKALVVKCYKEKPSENIAVYDAKKTYDSISAMYKIK